MINLIISALRYTFLHDYIKTSIVNYISYVIITERNLTAMTTTNANDYNTSLVTYVRNYNTSLPGYSENRCSSYSTSLVTYG